jgi:type I restriction enzyme S subunit
LCNLHYEKFANGTIKCIEDEIPFELPEGWSWERLSNLASFSGGKTPSTSKREYWEGNILWVTSKDMKCKYIDSSLLMISEKGLEQMQLYPENTLLLVTRSGILRHTIPVAILKKPATINQDLKAIMLYIPNLEEYIYICIKGMESRLILEYTKAGATVENINFDAFQKILLPIPPENQIQRIIDATNDTDEVIGKLKTDQEDLIDIIDKTKSKILDLAIHGKLVPQNPDDEPASTLLERIKAEKEELIKAGKIKRDKKESVIFKGEDNSYYRNYENESVCIDENIPFEIPSNWEWCNLSMIGSTNIGLTYKPEDIIENGTMVLRSSNIVNGKIDLSDLVRVKTSIRDNQYIEENDILICARNGSKALVGKCAIFSGISERASFGAFMAVYRTAFFKYVYYFLNSNTFRSTFNSDDTKQINQLTQDMIKNSLIPLPPFEEQLRIVETIENVFAQLETIAESLN